MRGMDWIAKPKNLRPFRLLNRQDFERESNPHVTLPTDHSPALPFPGCVRSKPRL